MAIPNISEIRDGKRVITKKPELLLPAGNLEKLKIAIHYGADAVFLGGQEFGLRSNADNFTIEEIKEGCEFAAKYGADIYVTANIIAHDENFEGLDEFLMALQDAGVRGIIVADPYIIERCKAVAPKVEVHISTQQSISNYKEVRYWESEGVHRVVLARETGYEEIKEITKEESLLESARLLSQKAHSNQVDKAGVDYFTGHIQTVVNSVHTYKEKIVAYLHDTVEDTEVTIEMIYEEFGEEIGDAVKAITKPKKLDYTKYIEGIKANELARAVKIADLKHNMDLTRLKEVREKDVKRVEKYRKALGVLEGEKYSISRKIT